MSYLYFCCEHVYASGFRLQVEFELRRGVSALTGPSGSGKTTVLALIAGLLRPQRGVIRLGEHTLTDTQSNTHVPPEKRHVGLVFQDHCLFPHLSVRQNLEYGQRRRPRRKLELTHLIEILEIGDLLSRYPHTLSGGEKQRVALGRTLLHGPDLLLLDEPVTGLDQRMQARVLEYLQRVLAEYQIPTLLVSHDPNHVSMLAQHTIVLIDGGIIGGYPEEGGRRHHGGTEDTAE